MNEQFVSYDVDHLPPGRVDPARLGRNNPADKEDRPRISKRDLAASLRLAEEERAGAVPALPDATE